MSHPPYIGKCITTFITADLAHSVVVPNRILRDEEKVYFEDQLRLTGAAVEVMEESIGRTSFKLRTTTRKQADLVLDTVRMLGFEPYVTG